VFILGNACAGLTMVSMDDHLPAKFDIFYPWHKSFGMLVLCLVLVRLTMRARARIPELPSGLPPWEAGTARVAHRLLYALMIIVPCMGYAMSSSYTQSDGVFFFGFNLPELLPKNDARFEVFRWLHRWLAYSLLGVVALHVIGALKHRFIDKDRGNDVLSRMT